MTEREWEACADPERLLSHLTRWGELALTRAGGDRRLRLFGAACCRAIWPRRADARSQAAVAVAERYADGRATAGDLRAAHGDAWEAFQEATDDDLRPAVDAECLAQAVIDQDVYTGLEAPPPVQAALLREIFGNPFRPVAVLAVWQAPVVVALARAAYDLRQLPSGHLDAARLAVLADALEEAGCDSADLLAHLRSPGPHVRGCWALDLLLGKA